MGTQTAIAEKIKKKRADYVLALKKNQSCMYEEVREYFSDEEFLKVIQNERKLQKNPGKSTWANRNTMRNGTYKFFVNQFSGSVKSGFRAEIEFDGRFIYLIILIL